MKHRVGIVGVGLMGGWLAQHLLAAGYSVIAHDINLALPDDIADSLDVIMKHCNPRFERLHRFEKVDANHMVAAHPRDCYGLWK